MIHKTKKRSLDEADKPAKCNGKVVLEESNNGSEVSRKKKKLKVNPPATSESKANKRRSQDEVQDLDHPHTIKKKKKKKNKAEPEDPQSGSVSLKQVEKKKNVTEQTSPSTVISNKSLKELKKEKKKLLKLLKNEKLAATSESKSKSEGTYASTDASLLKKLKKKNKKNKKFEKSAENAGDLDVPKKVQKDQVMQLKEIKHSLKGANVKEKVHIKKRSGMKQSMKLESSDAPEVEFLSEKVKKASSKQSAKSKNLSNSDSREPLVKDGESAKTGESLLTSPSSAQESKKKKKKKKKKEKAGQEEGGQNEEGKLQVSNDKSSKIVESKKSKEKKVISTKRKEFFKKKREQFKESKKLMKAQAGDSSGGTSSDSMSLEQIKEKILELQSRETLSNTAKRKLRVLKKKAEVLQSAEPQDQAREHKANTSEEITNDIGKKAKKSKKNALVGDKKDSNKTMKNPNKALPTSKVDGKKKKETEKMGQIPLFIEDREGDLSLKIAHSKKNDIKLPIFNSKKNTSNLTNGSGQGSESTSDEEDSDASGTKDYLSNVVEQMESEKSGDGSRDESEVDSEDQEDEGDDDSPPVSSVTPSNAPKNQSTSFSSKTQSKKVEVPGKKQRYVLFIGNLSYDSTTVDLKKHFLTKVDRVKDVRIPLAPGTNKPRGFAYVEVENSQDYEKGLSLHGSFLRGRPLKVEYTTSGSKSIGKKKDIVHKNKKLHAMRKAGMLAGSKKKRNTRKDFKKTQEKSQDCDYGEYDYK